MSYGVIRIQKFTAGSVRGIDIHDNRIKDKSHSNPDIDFTKSEKNYRLAEQDKSFYCAVQDRIKALQLPKAVRKDAIVMAQALVTSDKAFFDGLTVEQQESFFRHAFEFIQRRYGKENIISATVHLDESTPHLHVNFVPVTADGRLCAKDLLNRKEMQSLQDEAYQSLFQPVNLQRGEKREDKRRHLTTEEYKFKTQRDELKQDITELKKEIENETAKLEQIKLEQQKVIAEAIAERERAAEFARITVADASEAQEAIKVQQKKKNALEGEIRALENKLEGRALTLSEISSIKPKETMTGALKHITLEEVENLKKSAFKACGYKELENELKKTKEDLVLTKKKLPSIEDNLKRAGEQSRLNELEKMFALLPESTKKELMRQVSQHKSMEL